VVKWIAGSIAGLALLGGAALVLRSSASDPVLPSPRILGTSPNRVESRSKETLESPLSPQRLPSPQVDPAAAPSAAVSGGSIRTRLAAASDWKERVAVVKNAGPEEVRQDPSLMVEVMSGEDGTAVRMGAMDKLVDLGMREFSGTVVAQHLITRYDQETSESMRYALLSGLEQLILKHPAEKSQSFDVLRRALLQDASGDVRCNAAEILAFRFEREVVLPLLESALTKETDEDARKGLRRAISQAKD